MNEGEERGRRGGERKKERRSKWGDHVALRWQSTLLRRVVWRDITRHAAGYL